MNTQAVKAGKEPKGQGRVTTSSQIDPLLTIPQLAVHLGVSKEQIYKLRMTGEGPKAIKLGHKLIRYRLSDVEQWLCERESSSTVDA